jgi:hypothetical protein
MEGMGRVNAAKVLLAGAHTPRFVADINENVIPAWYGDGY